jgi:hypothetical protein
MKEAAPFLVFAFFLGLIWLQNRGRPREAPSGEPATAGDVVRRHVLGNPPVDGVADAFTRFGLFAAWLLGFVAIVNGVTPLTVPAGVLLVAIGVLCVRNTDGIRERLAERRRRSSGYRIFGGTTRVTPFLGVAMTIIGILWLVIGVADALR